MLRLRRTTTRIPEPTPGAAPARVPCQERCSKMYPPLSADVASRAQSSQSACAPPHLTAPGSAAADRRLADPTRVVGRGHRLPIRPAVVVPPTETVWTL